MKDSLNDQYGQYDESACKYFINIVVIPKIKESLYEYIDEAMIHFKSIND